MGQCYQPDVTFATTEVSGEGSFTLSDLGLCQNS